MPFLLVLILLLAAPVTVTTAEPDGATGGVASPRGGFATGGTEGGEPAPDPRPVQPPQPESEAAAARAYITQEADPDAGDTPPAEDDGGADVRVPLEGEEGERPVAESPASAAPFGGLARTGFAAAALALLGGFIVAAGLGMRRLAR